MSNFLYYSYPWKCHHEHIQNFFSTKPAWSHLPTSVMTLLLTHSQKWVVLEFAFLHSPTFKSFQFYLHNAGLLYTLLPSCCHSLAQVISVLQFDHCNRLCSCSPPIHCPHNNGFSLHLEHNLRSLPGPNKALYDLALTHFVPLPLLTACQTHLPSLNTSNPSKTLLLPSLCSCSAWKFSSYS